MLNTITNNTALQRKKLRNDLPSTFHLRSLTLLYLVFRFGISRLWRRVDIRLFLGCDTLPKTEVWCLRNVACHTLMFLPTHCRFFSCLFRLPNAHARQHQEWQTNGRILTLSKGYHRPTVFDFNRNFNSLRRNQNKQANHPHPPTNEIYLIFKRKQGVMIGLWIVRNVKQK